MDEQPPQQEIDRWHRWFAVQCNNAAWNLTSKQDRTSGEDQEMLNLAYASAYHWSKAGQPIHVARADVTLSHAHSLLGDGDLALGYARRALDFFEHNECEDWDLAFAHLEIALAAAVLGEADLHAGHYATARTLGEAIQEEEDRQVFLEEFDRIPSHVLPV
jgi:hypothetical protein